MNPLTFLFRLNNTNKTPRQIANEASNGSERGCLSMEPVKGRSGVVKDSHGRLYAVRYDGWRRLK